MKPEKKKRLEAAGWKVGTVSGFLELTDEETALIELKLDLAKAVRTADYLTERAKPGNRDKLLAVLAKAPGAEPGEYDKL